MATLIVLGTAQDGGVPHAGCLCGNCEAARTEPARRRLPASVGIVQDGRSVLVDATDAFAEQLHRLWLAGGLAARERGYAPPETIVLTHAHTGHYVGLWQLDRSVLAAREVRVLAPPRVAALLATNEPWHTMRAEGFIRIEALALDAPHELLPGLFMTPLEVPHRAEWGTDTVALRIDGGLGSALYVPDIDTWDAWERDIRDEVARTDIALLDGCFWEPSPFPGVAHPPVRVTMELLQHLVEAGKRVLFTHLNHSNPLCDADSAEAAEVRRRGFAAAREGETFEI